MRYNEYFDLSFSAFNQKISRYKGNDRGIKKYGRMQLKVERKEMLQL